MHNYDDGFESGEGKKKSKVRNYPSRYAHRRINEVKRKLTRGFLVILPKNSWNSYRKIQHKVGWETAATSICYGFPNS